MNDDCLKIKREHNHAVLCVTGAHNDMHTM